jgi:hypothetical protein
VVREAKTKMCQAVTLSGFGESGQRKIKADINFHVQSGFESAIAIAHLAILRAMVDMAGSER